MNTTMGVESRSLLMIERELFLIGFDSACCFSNKEMDDVFFGENRDH